MRKLQWNKIPVNKVVGKKNAWTAVGKMFNGYKVNFDQMEELFSVHVPQTSSRLPKEDSTDSAVSTPSEKKKRDEVSSLYFASHFRIKCTLVDLFVVIMSSLDVF